MRMSAGGPGEVQDEDDEEQSEKSIEWLLKWLQAGDLLPEEGPARGRRLPAHCLADVAFIAAVVARICPATHAAQAEALGETASSGDILAGCLSVVFKDAYDVELDAQAALRRALKAGERDMEPLGDIVALWRHILTFAMCCESKQRHINSIMQMPADLQAGLMELIEANERRVTTAAAAEGAGQVPARGARVSLSGLQSRLSSSGQREPRTSCASLPPPAGETATDGSNEGLVKENERLRERVQLLMEQVEKDRQLRSRTTVVLDGEFETFEKSWNLEKQLQERDDRVKELELQVRNSHLAVEENRQLREELLLAQSREAEHAAVKARLERCAQRLEEAGDLKLEVQAQVEKCTAACREKDALAQELAQLKSAGQQLDAWKAKVRDLELRQRETEAKVHAAEAQAKAMEAEQQRLVGEKTIAEEKLQDCQLEVAALRESGPRGSAGGEVYEPFTAELQERMRSLESRNAVLEQQLTAEGSQRVAELIVEGESLRGMQEHLEQEARENSERIKVTEQELEEARGSLSRLEAEHAEQGERLESVRAELEEERARVDEAEEQIRSASECNAMVSEELRQRLVEMHGLCEQLGEAQEALATTQEELAMQSDAATRRSWMLEEMTGDLKDFGAQLLDVREVASELQAELDASKEALQESRDEGRSFQRELEASRSQASQLEQRCAQLQDARTESLRLQKELQQLSEQERQARADLEGRLRTCQHDKADLARQLQHYRCEQHLHERNRADLAEREESSMQRQSDLLVRIDDLRHGLEEEAGHSKSLREQVEASEFFCRQLKAALRRHSPEELRQLEEEQEESAAAAAGAGGGVHSITPESELAQVRVENRRLHAQLSEQRLRGAEEVKRSAQACARLRHLEKCAEQGLLQAERQPAEPAAAAEHVAPATPSPRQKGKDVPGCRPPRQDSAQEAVGPLSARPSFAAAGTGVAGGGQAPAPRCSILKKPKQAPSCDFIDKENRVASANCAPSQPEGPTKTKSTFIRAKRPGLIGCIG